MESLPNISCLCHCLCLFVGQVKSPHHSYQWVTRSPIEQFWTVKNAIVLMWGENGCHKNGGELFFLGLAPKILDLLPYDLVSRINRRSIAQ